MIFIHSVEETDHYWGHWSNNMGYRGYTFTYGDRSSVDLPEWWVDFHWSQPDKDPFICVTLTIPRVLRDLRHGTYTRKNPPPQPDYRIA